MKTKTYTATEMRSKFKEAYNLVRYSGTPIVISNHGDTSVVMIRRDVIYPNPTTKELFESARSSKAFDDENLDEDNY